MKKNKIFSILLSVAIACGLWYYVVTTITPEDSSWVYNIPVSFTNEDGLFSDMNLILTEGESATVNLKFYGKRSDLRKLNRTNIEVEVDLNEVTGAGEWNLSYEYSLPDSVSSSSITLQARSSDTIHVVVEKLATRTIEVHAVFDGNIAEGYVADNIETEYSTLDISGPEDLVNQVSYAQVVLERKDLTKSVSESLPYTLYDDSGKEIVSDEIKCDVDTIDVVMAVEMVKPVPLTVTLSAGGGANEEHAVVDIEPSTITLQGDAETLETLNSINLGTVDLGSIQTDYSKVFTIVTPDNVENLSDIEATVSVELVNLKEKTFKVTNIEIANAPEDMSVVLGASSLQVKLRGDEADMENISESNIRAVVDLNTLGTTTGQFNVAVTIYVDGYPDVGAMGTYNILVTISESVSNEETPVAVSEEPTAEAAETTDAAETDDTE